MPTHVDKKPSTTKRMLWMIVGVLLLIALIAGIKVLLVMRMIHGMPKPAPFTVSTTTAREQPWQPALSAVGTLRAANGADLAMDVAGLVTAVNLKSGQDVKQGQLLVQLRDGDDVAQLQQLEAAAQLSQLTFERARKQLAAQAISKADYDTAAADLKAKTGRGGAAESGGGQEAAARAVCRPRRHHHHQPRRLPQRRHHGGDACSSSIRCSSISTCRKANWVACRWARR